jgi:hypothetical protein
MQVLLKNVRLAFPNLFEAKTVNGQGTPAFSATFILEKDHAQIKDVEKVIEAVASEKWGAKSKSVLTQLKATDKVALHNGDSKAGYVGFPGNFFISARTKTQPAVVDRDKVKLSAADGKPYAGCYVNAFVDIWAMDNQYGKRVCASLISVQFVKDGEAFSGSAPSNGDEFEVIEEVA